MDKREEIKLLESCFIHDMPEAFHELRSALLRHFQCHSGDRMRGNPCVAYSKCDLRKILYKDSKTLGVRAAKDPLMFIYPIYCYVGMPRGQQKPYTVR